MRCCVPFCKTTTGVSISEEITYHDFPTEASLRAAWLGALGQASPLPDCAVVCSLHFLHEDIYKTENGSIQVSAAAVPRAVQFCVMCLDTDSKLLSVKKHNLERAYESLTGYTMCEEGNLRLTLCVVCAYRLNNFSRFKDQSLRAHTLLVDFFNKYELITIHDMKMIKHSHNNLQSNNVRVVMEPDHYDVYIYEYDDEHKQTYVVKDEVSDISPVFENDNHHAIDKETKSYEMYEEKDTESNENVQTMLETVAVKVEVSDISPVFEKDNQQEIDKETKSDEPHEKTVTESIENMQIMLETDVVKEELDYDSLMINAHCLENNPQIKQEKEYNKDKCNVSDDDDVSDDSIRLLRQTRLVDEAIAEIMLRQTAKAAEQEAKVQNLWNHEDDILNAVVGNVNMTSHVDDGNTDLFGARTNATAALTPTSMYFSSLIRELNDAIKKEGDSFAAYPQTVMAPSPAELVTDNVNKAPPTGDGDADEDTERALHTDHDDSEDEASAGGKDTDTRDSTAGHGYHLRRTKNPVPILGETLATIQISNPVSIGRQSEPAISEHSTGHLEVATTGTLEPVLKETNVINCNVSQTEHSEADCSNNHVEVSSKSSSKTNYRYTCDVCKNVFKLKSLLVRHIRVHTGDKPFSCMLCEYKSPYKGTLITHMKTHTDEKPFSCKLCEYKSAVKSSITKHMRIHTVEKPFSCKLCEFISYDKYSLVNHLEIHIGEKSFSCLLCGYKCAYKSHLTSHMKTHTGEKSFSCKLCSYKFTHKNRLTRHMKLHTGEKPFNCKQCKYKCARNSDLTSHMRVHTGEKPFSCKHCEFKSAVKSSLARHMMLHSGERPFSCKLCSYTCVRKSYLAIHSVTHTGEKLFPCKQCEYKCADKRTLTKHLRIHTT